MDAPTSSPDNSTLQNASVVPLKCDIYYISPDWIHTVIPAYIYTISALGIPLNLLVLLVFLLHKKACTATEIYLSNMAAADLFLVVLLPFWGVFVSKELVWTFGGPMCKIVGLLIVLNYNCSIYFLVLVCLDRFLALAHPLLRCKLRRRKYAMMSCVVVWCFGLLLNIPTLMYRQIAKIEPYNTTAYDDIVKYDCYLNISTEVYLANEIIQAVVGFIIPLLIITFCTVNILRALKKRPREGVSNQKGERKVTVLVLAVLLAFLICWLPFRVVKILELAIRSKLIKESCTLVRVYIVCDHIFYYFAFFNSDLNPILYVIVGKNFRKKMLEVLSGRSAVRKSSSQLATTSTSLSILSSQKRQSNANGVI